ncbi:MAG: M23 family metallopeptidase [Lachnospiraceae bacterium]|nr:M23 family metallopeptidase [Lachnospiraceae bacterium]
MKRRRKNQRKEKMVMLCSSLFVLTALTMTGVYVKEKNQQQDNGYVVDFSSLENTTRQKTEEIGEAVGEESASAASGPATKEELPGVHNSDMSNMGDGTVQEQGELSEDWRSDITFLDEIWEEEELLQEETQETQEEQEPELVFSEEESLLWPVVGNVLINYSMDKTVYFATLRQYKYNPAIIIQAVPGETITAAADGIVTKIEKTEETGNTITMDIGSGYRVIYGQLDNMQVKEGDRVKAGDLLASVAQPTKYYSVEGSNVYFALTKDGTPIDPMGSLENI